MLFLRPSTANYLALLSDGRSFVHTFSIIIFSILFASLFELLPFPFLPLILLYDLHSLLILDEILMNRG